MSTIELGAVLPAVPIADPKTRWFKAPDAEDDPENPRDFDNWPRAARRLWKIILRRARKTRARIIFDPVWKLAELCARCERWVWKALAQLLEMGVIRRFWAKGREEVENGKGHHGEVGRATEIVIELAGPEAKAKPAPKAKGKTAGKMPAATTGALDAQRADWAKGRAEVEAEAEAEASPAEPGPTAGPTGRFDWRKLTGTPPEAPRPRDPNDDPKYRAIKAEMEAKEEARRRRERQAASPSDQLPTDPAGPEVPAPESGS
jgi:hypothetical protein